MSPHSNNPARREIPPTFGICATIAVVLQNLGSDPTAQEIAWLWHTTFEAVEAFAKTGKSEKRTKRSLLRFLAHHAGFLCENAPALRRNFNRKFDHWKMNGRTAGCVMDGRIEANQNRRVQLPDGDKNKIIAAALFKHGGDVATAWRDCLERGELSEEINQRYLLNPSRKSHVPRAVAEKVVTETKLLLPHFHGPRQAKLHGAYIDRDWSKVGAGDWYSSDDATLEIYAYLPDHTLTRGQFLPMIDERSKRILDFILVPEKNYTGINVRTLINKVCQRYGMPRVGFYLENGLWRKSKLVGGAVPMGEVQMNFAERLGIKITHTQPGNARAKVIENVLKLFQARLRGEPGWVGRNEQVLKIEHVQRAKLDVEAGRKLPHEAGFLSFEQWFKRLAELCEEYNATPQESKVMGGNMSPDDAWRLLQTRSGDGVVPLAKLPESCLYMLARDTRRVRIGRNGITLPKSLGGGNYRNEITGQLQGREVNIYFDLEMPELLSIVSDDRRQIFTVPIAPTCPAHDATPGDMAAAQASVAAHTKFARQRISQLRSEYMPPTRGLIHVDSRTSALGREMQAQKEKAIAQQTTRKRIQTRTTAAARKAGLSPAAVADSRALELLNQGLNDESN